MLHCREKRNDAILDKMKHMAPDDAIFTFNVNYLNRNIFYLEKVFSPIMPYYSSSGDSLHTICVITRIKICCTQCEYIFEDNQYLNSDGLHVDIIIYIHTAYK